MGLASETFNVKTNFGREFVFQFTQLMYTNPIEILTIDFIIFFSFSMSLSLCSEYLQNDFWWKWKNKHSHKVSKTGHNKFHCDWYRFMRRYLAIIIRYNKANNWIWLTIIKAVNNGEQNSGMCYMNIVWGDNSPEMLWHLIGKCYNLYQLRIIELKRMWVSNKNEEANAWNHQTIVDGIDA